MLQIEFIALNVTGYGNDLYVYTHNYDEMATVWS